jgi:tRNA(Ile)-lysidine synthase
MSAFAPFEEAPALAIAVSGGRDSMALALLAADWSAAQGGRITALTVDHGLRPESAGEARRVGSWLAARGIAHRILVWDGPHPASGVQAAARAARYRLLEVWCAENAVLHLLLGHQRDDQAETVRMRAARQAARGAVSGGLAGMAALRETAQVRLLRPLLDFPRARLAATLRARGQDWLDDPSNEDPRFERARLRRGAPALPADHAATVAARRDAEAKLAAALARCVVATPDGLVHVDVAAFTACDRALRRAMLARCVTTVGGRAYPPRGDRLDRLVDALEDGTLGRGRTLGGCRIVPEPRSRGARLRILREGTTAPELPFCPPQPLTDAGFAAPAGAATP